MTDILTVSALRSGYGETVILEDVAFSLPERGALAVLGRNGVGKTTLLATLMGRTTRHAGEIIFGGAPIGQLPIHLRCRRGIGYVPQTRDVFSSLSVEENLTVAARPGVWTLERVYDLFPRLAERRTNRGTQLSGGEQQMVSIGRALMGNPSLLLLDEPMEGLAPIIVEMLLRAFQRLVKAEALAVILVEQHARIALRITDEVIVMNRGRIIHKGASDALLRDDARLASLLAVH